MSAWPTAAFGRWDIAMATVRSRPVVVVLNDSETFLELMQDLLEREQGYAVQIGRKADEGVDLVKATQPDLVLLDIMFAREELGWTILEDLKRDPETAAIPVVVCSAATPSLRAHHDLLAKCQVPWVLKPFDLDQLLDTVEVALGNVAAV